MCKQFNFYLNLKKIDCKSITKLKLCFLLKELMKQQLEDHRNKGESQSQDFVTRVTELQNEMESYRVEIAEKDRTIQEARTRQRELEDELSDLKRELDSKQRECSDQMREIEKIDKRKADLEIDLNALQGKVNVIHQIFIT